MSREASSRVRRAPRRPYDSEDEGTKNDDKAKRGVKRKQTTTPQARGGGGGAKKTAPKKKQQPKKKSAGDDQDYDEGDDEEVEPEEEEEEEEEDNYDDDDEEEEEVVAAPKRGGRPSADAVQPKRRGRPPKSDGPKGKKAKAAAGEPKPKKKLKTRLTTHVVVPMWRLGTQATLLHVPHDVMRARILPYLSWSDARALSRVCVNLHEDAKYWMSVQAVRRFSTVAGFVSEEELNLAMALLTRLEGANVGYSKAQAMKQFCISEAGMRALESSASALGYAGRRSVYPPAAVIEAALRRHKGMTQMVAYSKKLSSNREAKALRKARLPERLQELDALLKAAGYDNFANVPSMVGNWGIVNRWLRNGSGGDANKYASLLIHGLEAYQLAMDRRKEITEACKKLGCVFQDDEVSVYRYMFHVDPVREAIERYAGGGSTLEAALAEVRRVMEERNARTAEVTGRCEQAGVPWSHVEAELKGATVGTGIWSQDRRSAPLHVIMSALKTFSENGEYMSALRVLEGVALLRVVTMIGPAVERRILADEPGAQEYMTRELVTRVLAAVVTQRLALFPVPQALIRLIGGGGRDEDAESPLLGFHIEYPSEEEMMVIVRDELATRRARSAEVEEIVRTVWAWPPLVAAVKPTFKGESYISGGYEHALVEAREAGTTFRKKVVWAEKTMAGMMELAGEDYLTLGEEWRKPAAAAVLLGAQGQVEGLSELLLRGFKAEKCARKDSARACDVWISKNAERLGVDVTEGFTCKWHTTPLDRLRLLDCSVLGLAASPDLHPHHFGWDLALAEVMVRQSVAYTAIRRLFPGLGILGNTVSVLSNASCWHAVPTNGGYCLRAKFCPRYTGYGERITYPWDVEQDDEVVEDAFAEYDRKDYYNNYDSDSDDSDSSVLGRYHGYNGGYGGGYGGNSWDDSSSGDYGYYGYGYGF